MHCVMTYRERISPIRSFPKRCTGPWPTILEFVPGERNPDHTLRDQREGEYAAMIIVHGTYRERAGTHRFIGVCR